MRYSGTWLTPEDEVILEQLRDGGAASPAEVAEVAGLEFSVAYLDRRCARLAGTGGLVAFDGGRYRLTGRGEAYLDGALDPSELGSS